MRPASDLDHLLTPGEVGTYLGVPLGTLANWRYLGRGPAYLRVGRHVRYRRSDVAAWMDALVRTTEERRTTSSVATHSSTAGSA